MPNINAKHFMPIQILKLASFDFKSDFDQDKYIVKK